MKLEFERKIVDVIEINGKQYIRINYDVQNEMTLPPDTDNTTDTVYSIYSSFGGTNNHTTLSPTPIKYQSEIPKELAFLPVAEIIKNSNDLTLTAVALLYAGEDDAEEIADALTKRMEEQKQKGQVNNTETKLVIGDSRLVENNSKTLEYTPFSDILSKHPNSIGVIGDPLILGNGKEPLFFQVKAVILENGKVEVLKKPILARKPSAGVGLSDGRAISMVGELRMATGLTGAEQIIAGSNDNELSLPYLAMTEASQEYGVKINKEDLTHVAVYPAGSETTEIIDLFSCEIDPSSYSGKVHGTDSDERTLTHSRDINLREAFGTPYDAKTMTLTQLFRLGVIKILHKDQERINATQN